MTDERLNELLTAIRSGSYCGRSRWPEGPWTDEPDLEVFEAHGLLCLNMRNGSGAWTGYVAIPPGHPLHLISDTDRLPDLAVHGGVNWLGHQDALRNILAGLDRDDRCLWIGWDADHVWDLTPTQPEPRGYPAGEAYRDAAFARQQTEHLAEQVADKRSALAPKLAPIGSEDKP